MLHEKIDSFYREIAGDKHHRYQSWEHCYGYFQRTRASGLATQLDTASLQLGFYLASWGMYRGSSFLLKRTYTVHSEVIECLCAPQFTPLWDREFGASPKDRELVPLILDAASVIKSAYGKFGAATDVLATKILLGTFGCAPACDRFFVTGFRRAGLGKASVKEKFLFKLIEFSCDNLDELRSEQESIKSQGGCDYPLMKLLDMYFWQLGRA